MISRQCRDYVFLGGFSQRRNIVILVDDRVAHENDLVVLDTVYESIDPAQTPGLAQPLQEFAQRRIVNVHIAIDQAGRTEGEILGEDYAAPVPLDSFTLESDFAGQVVVRIFVVRSLHIHVGPDRAYRGLRRGGMIDSYVVDYFNRAEHFGPHLLRKDRAAWPLI